jgi:membrane protease YdiL (CAAX protease family)
MKFKMSQKSVVYALLMSLLMLAFIIMTFLVTKQFIHIDNIVIDIQSRMKISKGIIVIAAVYTVFVNSFIEEYFFRGFIFQGLIGINKPLAFVASSLLFAIYHIGVFYTWFSLPMMCLALIGLFIGGLIFSFFVYKTKSVLASYFIHICSDIAIMIIGVIWIGVFT